MEGNILKVCWYRTGLSNRLNSTVANAQQTAGVTRKAIGRSLLWIFVAN